MKKKNPKKVLSKVLMMLLSVITFSCQDTTLEEVADPAAVINKKETNKVSKMSASVSSDLARRWAPIHYRDVDAQELMQKEENQITLLLLIMTMTGMEKTTGTISLPLPILYQHIVTIQ